jgi:nitric oxide reductase NorE protein
VTPVETSTGIPVTGNGVGPDAVALDSQLARRRGHVPGEPGAWVFILADLTVFAVLFVVFMAHRDARPALYARSQLELHRSFGVINTLLLLTSSLGVVVAVRALRRRMHRLAQGMLAASLLCGCAFLFNKYLEWSGLLTHHHKPSGSNFFMYFFVLTGLHAFHVLLGMAMLVAVFILARKPTLTEGQMAFVEGGTCFWHMVDLLWVVLFALLYLVH